MIPWKFGPHDQDAGPLALDWAASSNVVKACGNPAVLHRAPDHALRIWRRPFGQVESTRMLDEMAVTECVTRTLDPLNGYNHPLLFIELLNEVPRALFPRLILFLARAKEELDHRGYQLTGPCSATGDYEIEDVAALRALQLRLWTFHGYMTRIRGPTNWNAYRMRQFWLPGDPPVVYSESTYDRCRDGDLHINQGYIPLGDGPYGWVYQFEGRPEEEAAAGIISYARGLTEPWEIGSTGFTSTPNPEWQQKGFNLDQLIPYFIREYTPWRLYVPRPNDWYPLADIQRLPDECWDTTRDNNTYPFMICDHIADGNGNPGPWWISLLSGPPSKRASAHFWVNKLGKVVQYVPISGQAWSNGNKCDPDLTNILIKQIVNQGKNPNEATVSIEHEGYPAESLTPAQLTASQKLHHWLNTTHHIPLNRTAVVGHYQFDSCTRPHCPSFTDQEWTKLLGGTTPMPPTIDTVRTVTDAGWQLADQLQKLSARAAALGRPHLSSYFENQGEAIKDTMVMVGKGEK